MIQFLFLVVHFVNLYYLTNVLSKVKGLTFDRTSELDVSPSFFGLPYVLQTGVTVFLIILSYFLAKIDMLPISSPPVLPHQTFYKLNLLYLLLLGSSLCHFLFLYNY